MSKIHGANARKEGESAKMSASSDVLEMQSLCGDIAKRLLPAGGLKEHTTAVLRFFEPAPFTWNRVNEFLRAKARRVDSWEKDYARQKRDELKAAEQARKDHEHFCWLQEQIARHRASGEELRGPHILALEHVLRMGRDPSGAVEVRAEGEAAD